MAKENKFFSFFQKLAKAEKTHQAEFDRLLAEQIDKAIRFIKIYPTEAHLPEIYHPEQSGDLDVSIHADPEKPYLFWINLRFISLPDSKGERHILFTDHKLIDYKELEQLAHSYDKNKENIDELLMEREALSKTPSAR